MNQHQIAAQQRQAQHAAQQQALRQRLEADRAAEQARRREAQQQAQTRRARAEAEANTGPSGQKSPGRRMTELTALASVSPTVAIITAASQGPLAKNPAANPTPGADE